MRSNLWRNLPMRYSMHIWGHLVYDRYRNILYHRDVDNCNRYLDAAIRRDVMNEDVQLTNTVGRTRLFQWFMKFSCVARAATPWPPAYRSRTRRYVRVTGPLRRKARNRFRAYRIVLSSRSAVCAHARDSLWLSKFSSCALGPRIGRCIPI